MSLGRIGRYRLTAEIGRGGVGTVYRAVDPTGQAVAIKRLHPHANDHAAVERLLREATLGIEHPNVVRTLGSGVSADGLPYIVMELLDGETLRDALTRGISVRDLVDAVRQAALGLSALHERNIVHRDVKPENLFRCRDGVVKVLDLGIVSLGDAQEQLTATGAVVGTPAYLAPEQARGQAKLDARVDVWALGIVLYEGLTRTSPFRRDGVLASLLAAALEPLPPIDGRARGLPRALTDIVHRCLEKTPERRFASAAELATALETVPTSSTNDVTLVATPVSMRPASTQRSVALLLAEGLVLADAFRDAVVTAGGEHVALRDGHAIGLFGARVSRGDEATRALAAALVARPSARCVAMALGHATVGNELPTGDAVREAEQAATRAGAGLVCGGKTARALAAHCDVTELGPDLFAIATRRASEPARTVLLGRDVELAMLRRARDLVVEGPRAVVSWIVGPPGVGKTRLAEEVRALASEVEPAFQQRRAHAESAGLFAPWRLVLDLTDAQARPVGAEPTAVLERLRTAARAELERLLALGTLVVVLEDMQWADAPSIAFIEELVTEFADQPLWLVLTARPELTDAHPAALGLATAASTIEPAPLRASDAIAMAQARGRGLLSSSAAHALVGHTGGNPLFLELLLDACPEDAPLSDSNVARWPLPATLEHAVQARLDHLPFEEIACVVRLAIFGRPATAAELVRLGVQDAESALDSLARRDLVTRAPGRSGRTYRLASPVLGEVAAMLPTEEEQRRLHRAMAELGEAQGGDREEIALHLAGAGDADRAGAAFVRAALSAVRGGDARRVLRCAAGAVAQGLPRDEAFAVHFARAEAARWVGDGAAQEQALADAAGVAATTREQALVASEMGEQLRRSGRHTEALETLDRAAALARDSGDHDTEARATCRRATTWVTLGQTELALEAVRALGEGQAALTTETRAIVEDTRAYVAGTLGDHGARKVAFDRAAMLYREVGDLRRAAGAESNAADASNRLGAFGDAESALRRGLELARRVGNRLTEGYALVNLGYTLLATQRRAEAVQVLTTASELAVRIGDAHLHSAARLYRCKADLARPETVDQLLALADDVEAPATVRAGALGLASQALLARGEVDRACEVAIAALRTRDDAGGLEEGEAEIFASAARALSARGRDAEAEQVRARGRVRIDELAARITDPRWRESFREEAERIAGPLGAR